MSYARMSDTSDVYVYHHYAGWIECCGCSMTEPEDYEDVGFFKAYTAREILDHLDIHVSQGDLVPERCYLRIREEYPDIDEPIEEFKETKDES
jgi:hypothetical protein